MPRKTDADEARQLTAIHEQLLGDEGRSAGETRREPDERFAAVQESLFDGDPVERRRLTEGSGPSETEMERIHDQLFGGRR